jgi:hypothetical protein
MQLASIEQTPWFGACLPALSSQVFVSSRRLSLADIR